MTSASLDKSLMSEFFEGAEKNLKVFFTPSKNSLRNINEKKWRELLKNAKCTILSTISDENFDSYLLSESSLFVSDSHIHIKTCGQTPLLKILEPLLSLCREKYERTPEFVYFTRKQYLVPEQQENPHLNFEDEVQYLNTFFQKKGETARSCETKECFYIYFLKLVDTPLNWSSQYEFFEVLMNDMDPKCLQIYYKKDLNTEEVTEKSRISKLIPGSKIDSFLFTPCGYSMNGLYQSQQYWTMHITPQKEFCYASFECVGESTSERTKIVEMLKDMFLPNQCIVPIVCRKSDAEKVILEKKLKKKIEVKIEEDHYFMVFSASL